MLNDFTTSNKGAFIKEKQDLLDNRREMRPCKLHSCLVRNAFLYLLEVFSEFLIVYGVRTVNNQKHEYIRSTDY